MKTVFLTGGTGNMGWAAFRELYKHKDIKINFFVRPSEKNKEVLKPYMGEKNVEIIWGDSLDYEAILKGITGADYVLHIGGMFSPAADCNPYFTRKVNVGAAENICKAVLAQPNADEIRVCYIGSVAETGDRNMPIHWGRCGDPIKISVFDHYALSKVLAERIFVESGIKHWVVMRQSGILYPSIIQIIEPILFHFPLNGMMEWCTVEDAGRLMANFVTKDLPEAFFRRFYNIGSGKDYRLANFEFIELLLNSIGLGSPKDLFDPNWFVTRNFHGHFFADGDVLEEYLHFRANLPVRDYFEYLVQQGKVSYRFPKKLPFKKTIALFTKPLMKKIALMPQWGTLDWIKNRDNVRLSAYFGSYEAYQRIPSKWEDFVLESPDKSNEAAGKYLLDHGFDESKTRTELNIQDMQQAAAFRGGACLSRKMKKGDLQTKLLWRCGCCGAEFEASPNLILFGGHWCPECYLPEITWNYDEIAKTNPFFAQVWYTNHSREEHNVYHFDEIFAGWENKNE